MSSLKSFKGIVDYLESPRTPFVNIVFSFIAAVALRDYLEQFSDKSAGSLIIEVHYFLFFISLAIALIVLFHCATRESIEKIARVVLCGFIILPLVPLIDLVLSFGQGYPLTYFLPGTHHRLLQAYLEFCAPYEGQGVTPGQRMEIAVVIIMAGLYFYLKTQKMLRSIFFALLVYTLVFLYASLLFVLKIVFDLLGMAAVYTQQTVIWLHLLLLLPLTQILFYFYDKDYFFSIWKDSRLLRNIHYQLMVVLGFTFMLNRTLHWPVMQLSWVFIPPAIVFSGLFSLMVNNEEDQVIDRVSNKDRPTVTQTIPARHYKVISRICLFLALVYAGAVNFLCFFTLIIWMGNYYLYSAPPFRFKKVPVFSKMIIAFNSLLLFSLGFCLPYGPDLVSPRIVLFFLVGFTAAVNFIDIKDYEGDQSGGIKTLVVVLGLKKSKLLIGLFFFITYCSSYFLLQDIRLLPVMVFTGAFIFFLINKKVYSEKLVFMTYIFSMVLLVLYLCWSKATGQILRFL